MRVYHHPQVTSAVLGNRPDVVNCAIPHRLCPFRSLHRQPDPTFSDVSLGQHLIGVLRENKLAHYATSILPAGALEPTHRLRPAPSLRRPITIKIDIRLSRKHFTSLAARPIAAFGAQGRGRGDGQSGQLPHPRPRPPRKPLWPPLLGGDAAPKALARIHSVARRAMCRLAFLAAASTRRTAGARSTPASRRPRAQRSVVVAAGAAGGFWRERGLLL